MSDVLPEGVTRGPHGLVYHPVTYRCVREGRVIETVTVAAGGYEDTRLGMDVLAGDTGWEVVADADPDAGGEQGAAADAAAALDPEPDHEAAEQVAEQVADDEPQEGGE